LFRKGKDYIGFNSSVLLVRANIVFKIVDWSPNSSMPLGNAGFVIYLRNIFMFCACDRAARLVATISPWK
jgi:hypothetical protein